MDPNKQSELLDSLDEIQQETCAIVARCLRHERIAKWVIIVALFVIFLAILLI